MDSVDIMPFKKGNKYGVKDNSGVSWVHLNLAQAQAEMKARWDKKLQTILERPEPEPVRTASEAQVERFKAQKLAADFLHSILKTTNVPDPYTAMGYSKKRKTRRRSKWHK